MVLECNDKLIKDEEFLTSWVTPFFKEGPAQYY
jgi:hypothetical protein